MYIITKFKIFEEVRVSDTIKTDDKELLKIINKPFSDDAKLKKSVRDDNSNILVNIKYNDNHDHSIKERIKDRGKLKSISEFNYLISDGIIGFMKNTDQNIIHQGINKFKYAIYFEEYNITMLFSIMEIDTWKYNDVYYDRYKVYVYTLINGYVMNDVKEKYISSATL